MLNYHMEASIIVYLSFILSCLSKNCIFLLIFVSLHVQEVTL